MSKETGILENKMKCLRNLSVLSLTIAAFLVAGTAAKADPLSITFTPQSTQDGAGGDTLAFDVDVTNISTSEVVNFNSDALNITQPGSDLVTNDEFFANAPYVLNPGDPSEYEAFTVFISPGTPSGPYYGTYVILGGPTPSDFGEVGSATFEVDVASVVPEPSSLLLLLSGMAGLAGTLRRRLIR